MTGYEIPAEFRPAPWTVTLAWALLLGGAALDAAWAFVSPAGTWGLADAIQGDPSTHGLDPQSGPELELYTSLTIVSASLIVLVAAAWAVVSAVLARRGSRMALWAAVILCAVQSALAVLGIWLGGVHQRVLDITAETSDYSVGFEGLLRLLPGWYAPYTLLHNIATLVLYGLAGLLLVSPASIDFITRRWAGPGEYDVPR